MSSAFAIINICIKIKREFFFSFYFLFIKRTIDWSYKRETDRSLWILNIECVTLLKTNDVSRVKLENQN